MASYVALIRGIGPGDPKKSNESLRGVLESLGLENVQSVISSGNIIFESSEKDSTKLESKIENAWPRLLGFKATTIVRSRVQLQEIIDADHFNSTPHTDTTYQLVTFLKHPIRLPFEIPYQPPGKPYKVVDYSDTTVYSITDNTVVKTSDLMTWLEKQFTKELTSRTPLTIERMLKKMNP